jgi:hypothetical protein
MNSDFQQRYYYWDVGLEKILPYDCMTFKKENADYYLSRGCLLIGKGYIVTTTLSGEVSCDTKIGWFFQEN